MSTHAYDEMTWFDDQCEKSAELTQDEPPVEIDHPLDLKVVGERVYVIGSPDGYHNAPVELDGIEATVMRPSSIEGFVFVWLECQQREHQIHVSCLRTEKCTYITPEIL